MIQNTVVFIVNGDGSFFKQPPNTKFTANSVNKNSIFVIAPFVNTASIIANFKVAHKTQQVSRVATLTTMQPREITNESYVFDWNVWEVKVPQPTLQFLANNRGSEILVSFNVGETIPSRVIPKFDTILAEITDKDFILPSITVDGRYIVKVASYEYESGKYAFFNDTIIADNTEQEYKILRAKYSGGLTPSVAFKVDPSIPMENFDEYEPSVVEQLILQTNENSGEIVNLENEVIRVEQELDTHILDEDNPHAVTAEQVDTYNKATIDSKDADTLQDAKDYTDILGGVVEQNKQDIENKLDESIDIHNESATSHEDIRLLISTLNDTKLNNDLTLLVEEANLTLSDLFVVGKGSDTRKVSLAVIASFLSTSDLQLFTIVEELPTENQNPNTIYLLITDNEEGDNQLLEYIWIEEENRFELIGSVEVDLSDYYTKEEANVLFNGKVDKVSGKGLSTNDYTNVDKNKVDLIETGGDGTKYFGDDGAYHDIPSQAVESVNGQTGVVELDAEDVGALPDDTPLFSGDYDDLSNKPTIDQLLGNLSTLGFVKRTGTNTYVIDTSTYQPLDADLTAIASLSGTSGFLKKTSSNTWSLDTSVYLTSITKAMVEAVLTGTITTHTHNASDIVEDASHRFVTDTEKNTWNAKQNALGFTPENQANKKTTLTDNDVDFPTTKAVKTAIDTAISQTLKPMGNWNASTNTPELTDSDISKANQVYYVNVAGTQFGIEFDVGDELVYNTNGVIFRRDNVDAVISVNGKEGVVVLTQDDVADGSTYKRVTETEKTTWNNKVTSNTAITAGTKAKITYDAKGLVTAGADLVESDIPALSPTKITQNATNRFVTDTQISTWNAKQEALPTITQSQINAGTSTTAVVITPKLLRDNFYTETEIDNMIGDIESVLDTILGV